MKTIVHIKSIAFSAFLLLFSSVLAFAQEVTVYGTVKSAEGNALTGVKIAAAGIKRGTITDMNGMYSINVTETNSSLIFSFPGYGSQEVAVEDQKLIDVVLEKYPDAPADSILTGYTFQKIRNITGAVALVGRTRLTTMPEGNISRQLQGLVPGLTVTGSGQPGDIAGIRLRGIGTFSGGEPLFIVDGVQVDDISSLNPNDIESIAVLKDAGAAAIYGGQALNGVMVINTRKGSKGFHVTYGMYAGIQSPGKGTAGKVLNAREHAELQWLVYKNDRMDGTFDGPDDGIDFDYELHPLYGPSYNAEPAIPAWSANTDWYDAITEPAGMHNHDLTLSGAGDRARYYLGLSYFRRNGIIIYNHAERVSPRLNSEINFWKGRVKIGETFNLSRQSNLSVGNLSEASPVQMGPYRSLSIIPDYITTEIPGISHTFVPGEFGGTGIAPRLGNSSNAVANQVRNRDDENKYLHIAGSAYIDIALARGLNFRSIFGGTWSKREVLDYTFATYENSENFGTSSSTESTEERSDLVWTNLITLDKIMGKQRISAFGGYEWIQYGKMDFESTVLAGTFDNPASYRAMFPDLAVASRNFYFSDPMTRRAFFLKTDYSFMDKYFAGFSLRTDHAPMAEIWGDIYPALSAGWRISSEPFMSSIRWLNEMKIRGSYGKTGNLYANWETCTTKNVGFEGWIWNSQIGLVVDRYERKSENLLIYTELPGAGGGMNFGINAGSIINSGWDIEIMFRKQWSEVGLHADLVFTTYRNEITTIVEGIDYLDAGGSRIGNLVRNMDGHPMSAFYGYQVAGLFQNDGEVTTAPLQDGAEAGFFRYANIDATDNVITPDDRAFIGDPHPDFTAGLNLTLTWKDFDLGGFLYASQGNDILNWNKWFTDFWPSFQGQKSKDLLYNSWTEANTGATTPKASNRSNFSTNTQATSYYIEDGSYLRLKSLQLGYTIPADWLSKVKISSGRIYLQAVNLFTITKYTGLDPEIGGNDLYFGIDYGNYPNVRQFVVGLQMGI